MSFLLNSPYITYILGAFLIITVILLIFSVYLILYVIREYKKLEQMIDSAIDGNFQEESFDEQRLSRLQNKMYQFISSSFLGRKKVEEDKGKIEELNSNISHQTKTPIANILLYGQLLQEQPLPAESRQCVAALQGQADKINFLIASLVKLSRLETGILTVQPSLQSLQPLLQEITQQYTAKAEAKGICLTVQDTDEQAVFDLKWTTEALGNVVDNAVKYTQPGGTVRITVTMYELFCRIDVADTGIGIAEEEQACIFSRFYRSPQVAQQDGVGIGLHLARQILSDQGGYIKVSSAPGKGSVFSLFLQRVSAA